MNWPFTLSFLMMVMMQCIHIQNLIIANAQKSWRDVFHYCMSIHTANFIALCSVKSDGSLSFWALFYVFVCAIFKCVSTFIHGFVPFLISFRDIRYWHHSLVPFPQSISFNNAFILRLLFHSVRDAHWTIFYFVNTGLMDDNPRKNMCCVY